MKVLTGGQMRALDQKSIKEVGIPGIILMENAGRGVVEHMSGFFPSMVSGRIGICCGGGNNGGDGFVVARHLMKRGLRPEIFLFTDPKRVCGDAKTNLNILFKIGGRVYVISDENSFEAYKGSIKQCDIIVDALFGTGLRPPVTGLLADVIQYINQLHKDVVSVDIPSGLGADSPHIVGPCINAALTVTFALPKVSHLLPAASNNVGELRIVDIGIPDFLINETPYAMMTLDDTLLAPLLKVRLSDTHKGDYGHCLILAGSEGKTGAAYMAAAAALRAGAGLVTLGIPQSLNEIMAVKLTEAMTLPLSETPDKTISAKAWQKIVDFLPRVNSIAVGPGLSQNQETGELVQRIVTEIKMPMVIDADGINLLAGRFDLVRESGNAPILTPHPGEMARLIGCKTADLVSNRLEIVKEQAVDKGCYLLLKGHNTLIVNPKGEIFINSTGNPGMASGGMGDILTGMIAGLIAQGYSKEDATLLSVYLHGLAGDIAVKTKCEECLLATDLFDTLPLAFKMLSGHRAHRELSNGGSENR